MTSLIVPVVIWYSAPTHTISTFLYLPEKNCYVTGSTNGHICIWHLNGKNLEPKIYMPSQEPSPIIALITCKYEWKECILSVTADGSLSIFNIADGQCLSSNRYVLKCEPITVKLIGGRYLVAGGRTTDLEIVDIMTRKLVRRVEGHLTWIKDMVVCDLYNDCPVVGTLSGAGIIRFWTQSELFTKPLRASANEETMSEVFPISQLYLEIQDAKSISVSPEHDTVLVISHEMWLLYSVKGSKLLMENKLPNNEYSILGDFFNENWIIIWSKEGSGYVYSLVTIKELVAEKLTLDSTAHLEGQIQTSKTALVDCVEPICTFKLKVKDKILNSVSNFKASTYGNTAVATFGQGFISVWEDVKIDKESKEIYPSFVGSFESGWSNIKSKNKVTASHLIEERFIILNGHEDGSVSLHNLPYNENTIISWKAHDRKISCISHIKTASGDEYVISGSDDCYIKVWNFSSKTLVYRFAYHSGHVKKLIYPWNKDLKDVWQQRFFSVGGDNVVVMYQLDHNPIVKGVFGPHSSEIVDVRWVVEQDYLIIGCEDGSVYIWELETGELEQALYGKNALDIFANADPLARLDKQDKIKTINRQAITGITYQGYSVGRNNTPIQAFLINIGKLALALSDKQEEESDDINAVIGMKVFTYLFPWEYKEELDILARTELNMKPPLPSVSYGIMGTTGRMSVFVPNVPSSSRFTSSDTMTALHSLATSSLSKSLLIFGNNVNVCSHTLAHINSLMPEFMPGYVNPSLPFLASHWQDLVDDVMQCSRSIFISALDRTDLPGLQKLAQHWSKLLENTEENEASAKSRSLAILVLGILGSEKPESLTAHISNQVTVSLMDLIFQKNTSEKLKIAAVELLGKGFAEWSKHFQANVNIIIQKLFKLSTLTEPKQLTNTAHHALLLIGAKEPVSFLQNVSGFIYHKGKGNYQTNPDEYVKALETIRELIKKHPIRLVTTLELLVDAIIGSLDPHIPHLRNTCLKSTTSLVHDLVRKFPMIAFHQATQRLVVGTKEGTIFIYDLISATRWFTLEGHKAEVSAVAFEAEGSYLCSYSIQEGLVKVWKTSTTFFGILGSNPSLSKTIPVSKTTKTISHAQLLEMVVRIQWTSAKTFLLVRNWEDQGQNILELTR